jgi:hypothetical protein
MDYPSPQRGRANLYRDGATLRPSRRKALRPEHTCPNASSPSGLANGAGANQTRSRRQPAQWAALRQPQEESAWAKSGPLS